MAGGKENINRPCITPTSLLFLLHSYNIFDPLDREETPVSPIPCVIPSSVQPTETKFYSLNHEDTYTSGVTNSRKTRGSYCYPPYSRVKRDRVKWKIYVSIQRTPVCPYTRLFIQ